MRVKRTLLLFLVLLPLSTFAQYSGSGFAGIVNSYDPGVHRSMLSDSATFIDTNAANFDYAQDDLGARIRLGFGKLINRDSSAFRELPGDGGGTSSYYVDMDSFSRYIDSGDGGGTSSAAAVAWLNYLNSAHQSGDSITGLGDSSNDYIVEQARAKIQEALGSSLSYNVVVQPNQAAATYTNASQNLGITRDGPNLVLPARTDVWRDIELNNGYVIDVEGAMAIVADPVEIQQFEYQVQMRPVEIQRPGYEPVRAIALPLDQVYNVQLENGDFIEQEALQQLHTIGQE